MHDVGYRGRAVAWRAESLPLQAALQAWNGLMEQLPVGIYACDGRGVLVRYNKRAARLWGNSPPPGDTRYLFGAAKPLRTNGEALRPADTAVAQALRTGEPVRDRETLLERPDGTWITVLENVEPLLDHDGEIIGAVNCFQDVSALVRPQASGGEQRLRDLVQALPAAIYTTDPQGRITFYNQAAVDLAGRRPILGSDQWCVTWRLFHPDGTPMPHAECPMAIALKEGRPVRGAEAVAERPDGTRVPMIPYPTPLYDGSGALVGAVNMLVDISERKDAETRQKVLLAELNHRVKNTLATVQSLAAQTLRGSAVPADVRRTLEGRLLALSKIHDQLSRGGWESADLASIARDVFAPLGGETGERVRITGGPVKLGPHAALTLAMILHELATNAVKYGALSAPCGALTLSWGLTQNGAGRVLSIDWREAGGPPARTPVRCGFGTRLVERGIAHELQGSADLNFEPTGLRCTLKIPETAL